MTASVADAAEVNSNLNKMLSANGLITLFIVVKPAVINDLKN